MKKFLLLLLPSLCLGAVTAFAQSDVTVLLDSDFTVFTDGTEQSPKSLTTTGLNAKTPGYYLISGVSDAGGKLLVGSSGYIQAKAFSTLPTSGTSTLRFTAEVKMLDSYGGIVQATNGGYGSSAATTNIIVENDEWTTVTGFVSSMSYSSKFKLLPFLSVNGFYIKSLKIEYSADFIAAPEAYLPSDFDGTQFTASCSRVSGASSYLAEVFTLSDNGERQTVQEGIALTALSAYVDPSAKVTGLTPGVQYFYTVKAVNANGAASDESEPVALVKKISALETPEALEATDVTTQSFTANWTSVDDALFYTVNVYSEETLETEQEVSVFGEDFSGVNVGTSSSIEFSGDLNNFTNMPGWTTDFSKAFAPGYFILYPSAGTGSVITPAIDLSAAGGTFNVVINAGMNYYGQLKDTEDLITVTLLDADGNEVETATSQEISAADFVDYTFGFTKGAEVSRIKITYTQEEGGNYNRLFINEISVVQTLGAGSKVNRQVLSQSTVGKQVSETLEVAFEAVKRYTYTVIAVGQTVTGTGANASISEIMSAESNAVVIPDQSGVTDLVADLNAGAPAWKTAEGVIAFSGNVVNVYNVNGALLNNAVSDGGTATVNVHAKGVIIAVVDGTAVKIVM